MIKYNKKLLGRFVMSKQKPGRPPLNAKVKKTAAISINLSEEEKRKIEDEADKLGVSLSTFIRLNLKSSNLI